MTEKQSPKGIGGWLILPAIGIVLSIPMLAYTVFSGISSIFLSGLWPHLIDPTSDYYLEGAIWLLPCELIGNVLFFLGYCYIAYLFFSKHFSFPKYYISFQLFYVVFLFVDLLAVFFVIHVQPDSDDIKELLKAIIASAIWIPYMLKSVRVKNTFINGRRNEATYQGIIN